MVIFCLSLFPLFSVISSKGIGNNPGLESNTFDIICSSAKWKEASSNNSVCTSGDVSKTNPYLSTQEKNGGQWITCTQQMMPK